MTKLKFYIDGVWVEPAVPSTLGVVNPATEEVFAQISLGSRSDVDRAVAAARHAFAAYSETSVEERLSWLGKIIEGLKTRLPELARTMTLGAPFDCSLPFGGYKQSGNGREFGVFGFEDYLEVKAIVG